MGTKRDDKQQCLEMFSFFLEENHIEVWRLINVMRTKVFAMPLPSKNGGLSMNGNQILMAHNIRPVPVIQNGITGSQQHHAESTPNSAQSNCQDVNLSPPKSV